MNDTQDILSQAAAWRREGRGVAIATVVATWNSAPRPVGAKLAVDDRGGMAGSVSGGCVEGAVIETALEVIRSGVPRQLEYGVADTDAFAVGLACGGTIRIFVEALT
jgi:xanthine dehydrogenase accessory factor